MKGDCGSFGSTPNLAPSPSKLARSLHKKSTDTGQGIDKNGQEETGEGLGGTGKDWEGLREELGMTGEGLGRDRWRKRGRWTWWAQEGFRWERTRANEGWEEGERKGSMRDGIRDGGRKKGENI